MSIPFLIFSDAPSASSGLARITRDIATRIATHMPDVFRVATLGYGGPGSSKLPFQQYAWTFREDYMVPELPSIWEDFAGGGEGIILTIQDLSRMLWFARPDLGEFTAKDKPLGKWLVKNHGKIKKWAYPPMDAWGPNRKLTTILRETLKGYDRVLAYSDWAADIIDIGLPDDAPDTEALPHGIDTSVFYPRPKPEARKTFFERLIGKKHPISDDTYVVGIVATNQARKDFGLGIQTVYHLSKYKNVLLWIHTDTLERNWSLPGLLMDYGLLGKTLMTTGDYSDETLAWAYSACDVTLGIGLGEGFGYPIFESLACGTPVIHGDYGGAAEHLPGWMKVKPLTYRLEGPYSFARPVFEPEAWENLIRQIQPEFSGIELPKELDWNNLWPRWENWLRRGIE